MNYADKLPSLCELFQEPIAKVSKKEDVAPDPTLKANRKSRLDWSYWEKDILFQKHKELGNKWTKISKYLPSKTENIIKNYFYSSLRKISRKIRKNILPKMNGDYSTLTYDQISHLLDYLKEMIVSNSFSSKPKKKDTYLMEILSSKDLNAERIDEYRKKLLQNLPIVCKASIDPLTTSMSILERSSSMMSLHQLIQNKFTAIDNYLCLQNPSWKCIGKYPLLPEFNMSMFSS